MNTKLACIIGGSIGAAVLHAIGKGKEARDREKFVKQAYLRDIAWAKEEQRKAMDEIPDIYFDILVDDPEIQKAVEETVKAKGLKTFTTQDGMTHYFI